MRTTKILTVLIVVFCLAGVVDASLALGEHYNTGSSPCSINSVWDCGEVNHSDSAVLHGIPVAIIGIVGYALLGVLVGRFPWITAIAALAGFIFSLHLTRIEWKDLKVWCIYCVCSQVLIFIIFLLSGVAAWLSRRRPA